MEENGLFEEVKADLSPVASITGHRNQLTTVPKFQCISNPDTGLVIPADMGGSFAFTDYCGVAGVSVDQELDGVFPIRLSSLSTKVRFADITDGLSNTFAFGERPPNPAGQGYGMWLGSEDLSTASIGVFEDPRNFNDLGSFDGCLNSPIGLGEVNLVRLCTTGATISEEPIFRELMVPWSL